MSFTISQKSNRVLYLLRGLYDPAISGPLGDHGFDDADLERGWDLLRQATCTKLGVRRPMTPDPTLFQRLDAWENYWFPIIDATLKHNYPEVKEEIFLNLGQTEGLEVAISVGELVSRIRKAQAGTEQEQAAMALLAKRGLTEEVIGEMEQVLERLQTRQPAPPVRTSDAEREAAQEAMWAWYLEWSTIARQAITDRKLLRTMGFLRHDGSSSATDELEDEGVATDEATVETTVETVGKTTGAAATASPAAPS